MSGVNKNNNFVSSEIKEESAALFQESMKNHVKESVQEVLGQEEKEKKKEAEAEKRRDRLLKDQFFALQDDIVLGKAAFSDEDKSGLSRHFFFRIEQNGGGLFGLISVMLRFSEEMIDHAIDAGYVLQNQAEYSDFLGKKHKIKLLRQRERDHRLTLDDYNEDKEVVVLTLSRNKKLAQYLNEEMLSDPFIIKILSYQNVDSVDSVFRWLQKNKKYERAYTLFTEKSLRNTEYSQLIDSYPNKWNNHKRGGFMKAEMKRAGPSGVNGKADNYSKKFNGEDAGSGSSNIYGQFLNFPKVPITDEIMQLSIELCPRAFCCISGTREQSLKAMKWNDEVFYMLHDKVLKNPDLCDQIWEERKLHIQDMLYEPHCGMEWLYEIKRNKKKIMCHIDYLFKLCSEDRKLVKKVLNMCLILNLEISHRFFEENDHVKEVFSTHRDIIERYQDIQEEYRNVIDMMIEAVYYSYGPLTYVYYKAYYRMMNDIFSGFADVNNMSKYMYEMFDDKVFLGHFEAGKLDDFEKYCKEL